ncbi:rhamnan synthesis F family protein [Halomonas halmophila]|uniref:Glycosyl transferase family 1 n=1 Tax=Halomonas halmophila TaxID=252 RepID=A0A4Y4F8H4_9GAMM|nr:rhamnan synthesis F family protein [Halomonas halmophila]GED23428.1 hypothetical protein HHA01_24050 [Halomonas halmophila]
MRKYLKEFGKKFSQNRSKGLNYQQLTEKSISLKLFDPDWYEERYGRKFSSNVEAFKDYERKSRFSPVNPSPEFDTETYHRSYMDVFHGQISPLVHYVLHGRKEGRQHAVEASRWTPRDILKPKREITQDAHRLKVAACLHIFYEDFIDRFAEALDNFPINLDVLLTIVDEELVKKAKRTFGKHPKVNSLEVRVVPNRGRNFWPMLVEYSDKLQEYDLFCHLHSKKSLYSGKEQTQWADYLTEYLLGDPAVTSGMLNCFAGNEQLGIYYPTTFWMMPTWVNHLTMNTPFMREWETQLDLPKNSGFLSYPAGGMFWARPAALKTLLGKAWEYEDFPEEPLPNDGSMLHALERIIGSVAEKEGYKEFFYYPPAGKFTQDYSFIFSSYENKGIEHHLQAIQAHECISFDVFDTLVRREYTVPDYAKLKLGQQLVESGIVQSSEDFVKLRNKAELNLRKKNNFQADVTIEDIYREIGNSLAVSEADAFRFMQEEFELDLKMVQPKNEMVELFNHLGSSGHKLWVISDTYYTRGQVGLMLKKAGISVPYRLLVSSAEKKRKDNGSMWHMVKEDLVEEGVQRYLHIGDNVVADAQLPGDLGLATFHILHPMDKWKALGFPDVLQGNDGLDEAHILKWGKLVSQVGRNPFIGE